MKIYYEKRNGHFYIDRFRELEFGYQQSFATHFVIKGVPWCDEYDLEFVNARKNNYKFYGRVVFSWDSMTSRIFAKNYKELYKTLLRIAKKNIYSEEERLKKISKKEKIEK